MKQRKKQPQITRQAILEAAGAEFSIHGYAGSGLGSIVTRAELTKGALFHHFPDKRAMAAAWIEDHLSPALAAHWITPLELIGSLDALRAFCRTRCMELTPGDATSALVSLTAETAASDDVLGTALEHIFTHWRAALADLLERGKADGWIHRSIQPASEAAFVVSAFAGFSVTTRAHPEENALRTCATALEAYLETLRAQ
ncbi:MAG: TetR/AcrR family transcriptional regulator [Luteolibacter sp.]|jgi:AcrR family transcriptional regulator|nr:TetR/AcrR family transcriptional regulator [Luteolibacter sp.]